ncbi:DUF6660 family protein [Flavobacterium sp. 3HN19-14]|uniref:DUF6660 family protein n=1 Tax=Flavobacterium sp. 3HN19-14 TaxID=3448133 RepID=UPI003EE14A53
MKWLLTIFSIYLISLTVLPCHDSAECSVGKTKIAASHSHSDEDEQCSPFCSCACCGVQIAQFSPHVFLLRKNEPVIIDRQPSFYVSAFAEEMSFSIWQPPKLS